MKSILFVQNGNYREDYRNLAQGAAETYRDQKASIDFVARLAPKAKATTLDLMAQEYHTELAPNLWASAAPQKTFDKQKISEFFDEIGITHLVLRTPHLNFIREACRRNIPLLVCLADIFEKKKLRGRLRNWKMSHALRRCPSVCISNHSLNASRSLVEVLNIPPEDVVPWDWSKVPLASKVKSGIANPSHSTAFFAGMLSEEKGVGDCLDAIAHLKADNLTLSMSFAGPGDSALWQARAQERGISEQVTFLGTIPNKQVRAEMHAHDFVIVPSRNSYAEGLPNTIYEGLASRSALAISDHPAFAGRLIPDTECIVFPAADPLAMAMCLKRAILDPVLYSRLSKNTSKAHDKLYVGIEWADLVTTFLEDPRNHTGWVQANSLKTLAP